MSTYCGHKNYDYWNVALWLHNDEGLYSLMNDVRRSTRTKKQAAKELLSMLPAETPDGVKYTEARILAALD